MNRLYRPYWLLLTITIPNMIIFAVFSKIYYIINSELSNSSMDLWRFLGIYIAIAGLAFTIYGIRSWIKEKELHHYNGFFIFAVYTIFLLVYFIKFSTIIPWSIPQWMLLGIRPGITMLTLVMPALAHSMLMIVNWSYSRFENNISKDFLFMIGIPGLWYIAMNIFTVGRFALFDRLEVLIPIIFVVSVIAFFFFFIRVLISVLKKKSEIWQRYIGIIVLGGSLAGLGLNQSLGNLLGDFSHYSFYVLAGINGVLMIVPLRDSKKERLLLFLAKSITLVFTLYFFIVFLPYLPLSLVGIIVFGAGVLMLVPLVLIFVHVRAVWIDYSYLNDFYNKKLLGALFLVGLLIIPSTAMAIIGQDKEHVNNALKYTYQRSFKEEEEIDINVSSIERALKNIKYNKGNNRNNFDIFATNTPYLTSFYNWYVLDNLSISNERISRLEEIFLGQWDRVARPTRENNSQDSTKDVFIKNIDVETELDSNDGYLRSWIHLEIQNKREFQNEYTTSFELEEGSYISDYYLFVGDEKKHGLVADKRAANWVYQQIRSIRRDPGILTYYNGNNIDFKVFPFAAGEARRTGIEIVHRNSVVLNIDGREIKLEAANGGERETNKEINIHEDIAYIPREIKSDLPKIIREPRYYFVIDYSKTSEGKIDNYIQRVEEYIVENNIEASVGEIISLNFEESRIAYDGQWKTKLQGIEEKGGYNLDYSIKRMLYENYINSSQEHPVIIAVTDHIEKAILSRDFHSLEFTAPEGLFYYHLDRNNKIIKHSLLSYGGKASGDNTNSIQNKSVLEWKSSDNKKYYIRDDGKDSIVLLNDKLDISNIDPKASDWKNGVILKAMYMSYMLHPEEQFMKTLNIVKGSILSNVMSPLTSFIVLENEAQEKVMLEKQKQILATDKPLDIGELREMNEPSLLILGMMLAGIIVFINKRKKQQL